MVDLSKEVVNVKESHVDDIVNGHQLMDCHYQVMIGGDTENELYFKVPRKPAKVCQNIRVQVMIRNTIYEMEEAGKSWVSHSICSAQLLFRFNREELEYKGYEFAEKFKDWKADETKDLNPYDDKKQTLYFDIKGSDVNCKGAKPILYLIFHCKKDGETKLEFENTKHIYMPSDLEQQKEFLQKYPVINNSLAKDKNTDAAVATHKDGSIYYYDTWTPGKGNFKYYNVKGEEIPKKPEDGYLYNEFWFNDKLPSFEGAQPEPTKAVTNDITFMIGK